VDITGGWRESRAVEISIMSGWILHFVSSENIF
jgi:hypothetical protein